MLALAAYEDTLCRCGCGLPAEVAHSKGAFVVDTFTCYAGRAIEAKRRMDRDAAKADKKPEGWADGLHYWVRPHEPDPPQ